MSGRPALGRAEIGESAKIGSDAERLAFEAGLMEGKRLAALDALVRLKQLGLDLVREARAGGPAKTLLGNTTGVGSLGEASQPLPTQDPLAPVRAMRVRAAARAAKAQSPRGFRTEARLALLREGWPAGVPTNELADAMDRLPGPPVNRTTLSMWAFQVGLKRPDGFRRGLAARPTLAPLPIAEPLEPALPEAPPIDAPGIARPVARRVSGGDPELPAADETGYLRADPRTVRAWAEARGLVFDGRNLETINRVRAGTTPPLPPFRLG